jgi:hypothetical protein
LSVGEIFYKLKQHHEGEKTESFGDVAALRKHASKRPSRKISPRSSAIRIHSKVLGNAAEATCRV